MPPDGFSPFQQPFGRTAARMSDLPRAVTSWRDQVERLSPHTSPCRYRPPTKWVAMRENALTFIDRFGAEAYRQGRAAPQLFGVHPVHGTVRGDCCGVQMAAAAPASGGRADPGAVRSSLSLPEPARSAVGHSGLGARGQGRLKRSLPFAMANEAV
jgi:hypothetical protein